MTRAGRTVFMSGTENGGRSRPAGSERRPPRCPLTKGPKSPKVADDVQADPTLPFAFDLSPQAVSAATSVGVPTSVSVGVADCPPPPQALNPATATIEAKRRKS